MRICFCALATGRIPTMNQLLQASEPSFERGTQNLKDISLQLYMYSDHVMDHTDISDI